jgi:hypothetical protein
VVEQGTHKPLVGSSNLPPGKFSMCERFSRAERALECGGLTPLFIAHLALILETLIGRVRLNTRQILIASRLGID